mmetsp:Transcript_33956/g.56155  ORF Transcript_33956/g.56155 Transcript_33956/m.56155 type:complete len:368 (+) Transcript_33956:48-1151(+)
MVGQAHESACRAVLKPVDANVAEQLVGILKNIMQRKLAKDNFNAPVDYIRLKILNYPLVIKQPMDLGAINANLEGDMRVAYGKKRYRWIEEFAHDVRLVWKNAFLFNTPQHEVFKAARVLCEAFEEKLAHVHEKLEKEALPCHLTSRCQLLLSDMLRNPLSEWYRREVDWKQLGQDYLDRLKSNKPMDLNKVQQFLDAAIAAGDRPPAQIAEEFSVNVRLVWQNAIDFNGPNTCFGIIARILSDTFERRYKQILNAPVPPPLAPPAAEREGMPSFKRKRELYNQCVGLTLREASKLAQLVSKTCPDAVVMLNPGLGKDDSRVDVNSRVRVDLDGVDIGTFEKAEKLVTEMCERQRGADELSLLSYHK